MTPENPPQESIWKRELPERAIGLIGLTCGSVLIYLCLVSPLAAAANHASQVSVSLKGVALAPLLLALGIAYSVFGKGAVNVLGHPQRPSALGWAFSLLFIAVGIVAYLWLKAHLARAGYSF